MYLSGTSFPCWASKTRLRSFALLSFFFIPLADYADRQWCWLKPIIGLSSSHLFLFFFTLTPPRRQSSDSFPVEVLRPCDSIVVGSNVKKKKRKKREMPQRTRRKAEKRRREIGENGRLKARQNLTPGIWTGSHPLRFQRKRENESGLYCSEEYGSRRNPRWPPSYLVIARPFVFWNTNEGSWLEGILIAVDIFPVENTAVRRPWARNTKYIGSIISSRNRDIANALKMD